MNMQGVRLSAPSRQNESFFPVECRTESDSSKIQINHTVLGAMPLNV